jgi:hypothetical protein
VKNLLILLLIIAGVCVVLDDMQQRAHLATEQNTNSDLSAQVQTIQQTLNEAQAKEKQQESAANFFQSAHDSGVFGSPSPGAGGAWNLHDSSLDQSTPGR